MFIPLCRLTVLSASWLGVWQHRPRWRWRDRRERECQLHTWREWVIFLSQSQLHHLLLASWCCLQHKARVQPSLLWAHHPPLGWSWEPVQPRQEPWRLLRGEEGIWGAASEKADLRWLLLAQRTTWRKASVVFFETERQLQHGSLHGRQSRHGLLMLFPRERCL